MSDVPQMDAEAMRRTAAKLAWLQSQTFHYLHIRADLARKASAAGASQSEIADLLGVDRSRVARMINSTD